MTSARALRPSSQTTQRPHCPVLAHADNSILVLIMIPNLHGDAIKTSSTWTMKKKDQVITNTLKDAPEKPHHRVYATVAPILLTLETGYLIRSIHHTLDEKQVGIYFPTSKFTSCFRNPRGRILHSTSRTTDLYHGRNNRWSTRGTGVRSD